MAAKTTRDSFAREQFLQRVRGKKHDVEADTVIARDNVYRVDGVVHLMVRTSRFHERREVYFYGLTRHIFENYSKLPHATVAFIFADTSEAILVPAGWLWQQRDKISSDSKQYKLEINKSLRLTVRKGAGDPIDLSPFHERFDLLNSSTALANVEDESKVASDGHSALQGMLLEIGNIRGFQTYSPNKSPRFGRKTLGEIATVDTFPEFPGLNTNIARQIDVIWFDKYFPVHAFELELSTGIWTGLVRLGELRRLNTVFHIITDGDDRSFRRRIAGDIFADLVERCFHANAADIRKLHDAELNVRDLRKSLTL